MTCEAITQLNASRHGGILEPVHHSLGRLSEPPFTPEHDNDGTGSPAWCAMNSTFGARLRNLREERQVSLETIAAATKIKLSLLEGLEQGDASHWPKGIFGRAYLRDYARIVGLEPEALVRDFLEHFPDTTEDPFSAAEATQLANDSGDAPPVARLRRLVTSAVSSLLQRPDVPAQRRPFAAVDTERRDYGFESSVESDARPVDLPEPEFAHGSSEVADELNPHTDDDRFEDPGDFEETPEPQTIPALSSEHVLVSTGERRTGRDRRELSLASAATLCSKLARAMDWRDIRTLLGDAARLLDAVGVILWMWDGRSTALRPSVAHGYSDAVLASLPAVGVDERNAIAAAYRSGESCLVDGADGSTGAVVVPAMGPGGCVGVLALEVRPGSEQRESVHALAMILASQLGMLLPPSPVAEATGG